HLRKGYEGQKCSPYKLTLLDQYDNDKKWELVCDQERFQVKSPPSTYLAKIKSFYQDQGGVSRRKRIQDATQVLKALEISLRTNHIGWAQEFLDEQNKGLDVLVEYLSHAQSLGLYKNTALVIPAVGSPSESHVANILFISFHRIGATLAHRMHRKSHLSYQRDDIHVCIMCLRAIMNYQSGFNLVMNHPRCVNEITLSLNSRNPRTKALVLELLAAVCLVRGGHDIILSAFDNFKEVKFCKERNRFEKLMEYFINDDNNIDFMVACMQFINIVVHSVENMNFRVHLQYEFTHLGLDKYLESVKQTESEKLQVQIQAYLDNVLDVGALLEDAENRGGVLEHVEELQNVNVQVKHGFKSKKPIQTKYRMPLLNWQALKPNQVSGTVFNELDDEQVLGELNMEMFEEHFKTRAQGNSADLCKVKKKMSQKAPTKTSLIDANKAKNLAITLRKGGMSPSAICTAIEKYDQKSLSIDFLELLEHFIPSDFEMKLLVNYEKDGRPLEELTDEDRFILSFGKISRLRQRINTLTFMGNFPESVRRLQPQLNSVIAASMSIKSSTKLKKILEIVLAFGNYMNSSKRGAAYGFRLQSLDLLLETKSTDRSQTLLHFMTSIILEKYPELANFHTDLHFVDKAALVSLDGILQDIRSLERGMEMTKKEFLVQDDSPVLKEFIKTNSEQLDSLIKDSKTAQEAYVSVVEYFGENPKTTQPSMFFPMFGRFVKAYKVRGPMMPKMDLIAELKKRQVKPPVREGKDGALEDIITGTVM
uniref:Formin like 1 n=1 Tax=Nothobranchius furzeri TaxID=105023 RepID=A0A8C6KKD8_NOTFU